MKTKICSALGPACLLRESFQALSKASAQLIEGLQFCLREPQPNLLDRALPLCTQRFHDALPARGHDVRAFASVVVVDVRCDEPLVGQLAEDLTHGSGTAFAFAGEQARHEVLRLDLLQSLPLLVRQTHALCQLAPPLGKNGGQASQNLDRPERLRLVGGAVGGCS